VIKCIINEQWWFEKNIFSWAVGLNTKLETVTKSCCKQMSFVGSFIEHRQSRVSIILKDLGIFSPVNELQLQVTSFISPWQESACPLKLWSQIVTSL
jgi:hypothetical protein